MEIFGELERIFATSLYPLRVPIAIGLVIGIVVLIVVARRRGWFAAARRHPGRTGAVLVVALVVGGPVAWYLGSPLFIRTVLEEPAPSVAAGSGPTAAPPTAAPATMTPSEAPSGRPSDARSGQFQGADEFHFGSGTALLIETEPGSWIVRFEDFSVRNGPDLYVYLSPGPDGYADGAVELGTLRATDGSFNTDVPVGTDVTAMRSVVIWCKAFAVQFAHATLE
ncbi:MAG TPA: DM13 domain-containing protein [Candidatus Deferrimicrobiaceae bacterium]|nr:DM13 domain-containing protein [Candidatus Deferrimicrobiaceae bacterium]